MDFAVGTLDLSIIVLYLVVVAIIGVIAARKTKSSDDLFLAGRSLGWFPIGLSLFASNISSTTLIGLAGAAYTWGIAVANYEWMAALVLIVFSIFLIPVYLRTRVTTVPEFLELRFDRRSRLYFSGLTLFANVFVDTAGGLFAGAVVIKTFFPEVDIFVGCIGIALFAGIYTAAGGLAAVVYTDVLQAIVLFFGSCLVTYYSFAQIDFTWANVQNAVDEQHLSLILPLGDPNLPWLGTLIGVPVLGFYFWCTNQFITQRVLAARDLSQARWGSLFAGLLKLPVLLIMVIPGTMALVFLPNLPRGDMVFPALVKTLLPPGLVGLVLAGLVAAIMSSVDSTLNSASTLVTIDFIKPHFPNLSDKAVTNIGRGAIVVFMVVSALFAPTIANFEGLFQYLQTALAYLVPPVAVLFSLGVFWKRGTAIASLMTLALTHAISIVFFALNTSGVTEIHFTIVAGILFMVGCVIFVTVSLMSAPPAPSQTEVCFTADMADDLPGVPVWKNYKVLSAGLFILTAVMVIAFW